MIHATASGKTQHLIQRSLGVHRGARRLWLEGKRLHDVGFKHGVRYQLVKGTDALTLKLTAQGDHKVSGTPVRPIVDLHAPLGDVERVEVRFVRGALFVSIHPADRAPRERLARLNGRLSAGQKLRLGSLCHGGGVSTDALLRGLGAQGSLEFALEYDQDYIAQSLTHGPLSKAGRSFEGDLGDIDPALLGECEVLEAGLPCVSASRAGRAKKDLAQPEDDDATADLVVAFCNVVRATRPAIVLLENVPEYATSASAAIIRRHLTRLGYDLHEIALDGAQWSLEARQRWVLVATTRGLDFDPASLVPTAKPASLGEVLDKRVPASSWRSTANLDAQLARAKAKGQGFARGRKLLDASATSVPTLRRGYQKGGKCDPRLAHPSRPGIARLFSAAEHARIKGIPPALVKGLSEKKAHEVLGQSVISPAFTALGALIGAAVHN